MPVYDYICEQCKEVTEVKMTMAEHSEKKNSIGCKTCGNLMTQNVARLRFKLNGNGWYDMDYGISDIETTKNLESEKRMENTMDEMNYQDHKVARNGL